MKTADLFENKTVFSLEVFPPKPDTDESVIYDTLNELTVRAAARTAARQYRLLRTSGSDTALRALHICPA